MEKNILIVHYNTPELTMAAILSIWKHTPDAHVFILDNSDKRPLDHIDGVTILDNTKGQLIDFDKVIGGLPKGRESINNYGSARHCYSIDYCMDLFDDGFLLLDPDILVKKDVTSLFDDCVCWVGEKHTTTKHSVRIPRLYPFCCFINTRICKKHNIRYFDYEHMWELECPGKGSWYDTGAWFLEASKHLPHRYIRVKDYIIHYGGGSFRSNQRETQSEWLNKYSKYYE